MEATSKPPTITQSEAQESLKRNDAAALQKKLLQKQVTYYAGPIPDPETLQKYEIIEPGFAGRILAMTEKEINHRHSTDLKTINYSFAAHIAGLTTAAIVTLGAFIVGGFVAYSNHPWVGIAISGFSLAPLASAFIRGKLTKKEEKAIKNEISAP